MSDIDIQEYGSPQDYKHHDFYDKWIGWVTSIADDSESGDQDDYDDHNGFYRMSLSTKDPKRYLKKYKNQFHGKRWFPKDFYKRIYLRNFLVKTRSFINDLKKLDLSDVGRRKRLRTKLIKAMTAVKSAEKHFERDHFKTINKLAEAFELGKTVLEELRFLDMRGRLD
jgi:hypothetical protein